jgi:hypothetical protein
MRAAVPADVPTIVVDDHVTDRDEAPRNGWRTVRAGKHRGEDEPNCAIDAAGPGPAAGNLETAVDRLDLGSWYVGDGEEIVRIFPDLLLSFEWKKGRHPAEANRQRSAPSGTAAGAAKFEADLCEFGGPVLISAEALGLHEAEHARIAKRLHGLGGHSFSLL